jgi:hypothetical protein
MFWIYIIKCKDGYFYVGQTKRLYRRFIEHLNSNGGKNTSTYKPEEIVAIYKMSTLGKYFDYINGNKIVLEKFNESCDSYDNEKLTIENHITECLMLKTTDRKKIRGGKYIHFHIEYNKVPENDLVKNIPLCNCNLPCDIKKNDKTNTLYFRCAKKNMWTNMKSMFETKENPCNFFHPLCHCGLPCTIRQNIKNTTCYYVCPNKIFSCKYYLKK